MRRIGSIRKVVITAICVATSAVGQTRSTCPTGTALTLAQVVGVVANKVPPSRIAELVGYCHVAFQLNPPAVEQLADAPAIALEALDRDTISRLSVALARAEVAALEQHMVDNGTALNRERDAQLIKINSEFEAKIAAANQIAPKDPFEKTSDYELRRRKAQEEVTRLEGQRNAERSGISRKAVGDLQQKNQPSLRRIAALKAGHYPLASIVPRLTTYDADAERQGATVGGEEYQFAVAPARAKALNEHSKDVRALQNYDEDPKRTRYLADGSGGPDLAGFSVKAVAEIARKDRDDRLSAALSKAQAQFDRADYVGAVESYDQALQVDPQNQVARRGLSLTVETMTKVQVNDMLAFAEWQLKRDGFEAAIDTYKKVLQLDPSNKTALLGGASAQAEFAKRQAIEEQQRASGVWVDRTNKLMWTTQDNGATVDWKHAFDYCTALRTAGFSDWRLATRFELGLLFDPKNQRNGTPVDGNTYKYKTRPEITLTTGLVWSGTKNASSKPLFIAFFTGQLMTDPAPAYRRLMRVLCARQSK